MAVQKISLKEDPKHFSFFLWLKHFLKLVSTFAKSKIDRYLIVEQKHFLSKFAAFWKLHLKAKYVDWDEILFS